MSVFPHTNKDLYHDCIEPILETRQLTMAKKNFAHLSLNTYLEAVCKVNYKKSVTIRKIFKNSSKLDQAEYCNIICLKKTTK